MELTKKNKLNSILLFFYLMLSTNFSFSQNFEVEFERECYINNSETLKGVLENTISSKKILQLVNKEKSKLNYKIKPDDFYDIFKMFLTFDEKGKIIDIGFVRNADGKINKRELNKIKKYIIKNNIKFKVCWNNLMEIDTLKVDLKQKYQEQFKIDFFTIHNKEYRMNVYFPGYITNEFYSKYLR